VPAPYSTKLSPWLALGCVSARTIAAEVRAYEAGSPGGANESTYWVLFELLWRDFFKVGALAWGDSLFKLRGPAAKKAASSLSPAASTVASAAVWRRGPALLRAWCTGHTGYPFVDAAMRELLATGFQSNRSRQNVASFLAKDMGLDWRAGAEWFESLLIDHDPCANYVSAAADCHALRATAASTPPLRGSRSCARVQD
jgi:deoxyribodipyrimidine photo-lyase